ncbi:hypothetical protein BDR03DRAFT_400615 [Suillus americanus]|nr:hypothetical protein BDR03DRAFT_400615 [Suillus americanus]
MNQCLLKLKLPDTPTSSLEAPSIKWLLETSTDPEVFLAAASLVPHVDWPLDLDVSDTLGQLYDIYNTCLDVHLLIIPSLEEKASACTMVLCHLYCGRILQRHPDYRFLGQGISDCDVFHQMSGRTRVKDNMLVATTKLSRCSHPGGLTSHRSLGLVQTLSSSGCLTLFLSTLLQGEWMKM